VSSVVISGDFLGPAKTYGHKMLIIIKEVRVPHLGIFSPLYLKLKRVYRHFWAFWTLLGLRDFTGPVSGRFWLSAQLWRGRKFMDRTHFNVEP
jgi:hypothetical protein